MYKINKSLERYYQELDPKLRLTILDSLNENEVENLNFIHEVYDNRYSDHDKKGRKNIDWWLWRCVCLQILCGRGRIFKKFRDREVIEISNELLMNDEDIAHRNFLYYEYRNVARRYLSTCNDANYASSFLGLRRADNDEKIYRACRDIWEMSRGISRSSGLNEKMNLWNEALHDELIEYSPLCKSEYQRLDS